MRFFFAFLLLIFAAPAHASTDFAMDDFRQIPVLHEGRVKPLESFARAYLLAFNGHSALPGQSATAWLAEVLFDPQQASQRVLFNIPNPDVVDALGLPQRTMHYYSFAELSKAFEGQGEMIGKLTALDDDQLTPAQQQVLALYSKATAYAVLSSSLALVTQHFKITDATLAKRLHLPQGKALAMLDLMPHESEIYAVADELKHKKFETLTAAEKERLTLAAEYARLLRQQESPLFRIVPPQWEADGDTWLSPSANVLDGHGSPQSAAYLALWQKLAQAYAQDDKDAWRTTAWDARKMAYRIAGLHASSFRQNLEAFYLRADLLAIALGIYLLSAALLTTAFLGNWRSLYKIAAALMLAGVFIHASAIVMRIIVMNRPPVATLYETTIFVAFIAAVLSLLFEARRRDTTSLLVGSILGMVLLFVSTRYAADGDTMEMLVAVLNTNFWLSTHVMAIMMGYGCSLVAGTLAHVYLAHKATRPGDAAAQQNIMNGLLAAALIATFFTTLGTILGGIWADQSWGRFWGWDPKENGAMLIVLWLLWLLHGRMAGVLSPLAFATGMAVTNIVVALSWFGVNLLSVGLHSYGFTKNIAANLGFFCAAEVLFISALRFRLLSRRRGA